MENFYTNDNCPIRDVLSRLGDKWSMLVLVTLNANGTMRCRECKCWWIGHWNTWVKSWNIGKWWPNNQLWSVSSEERMWDDLGSCSCAFCFLQFSCTKWIVILRKIKTVEWWKNIVQIDFLRVAGLRNRFILGECRLVSGGNRAICMVFGRFYSGWVSRVERGRGVLAGKGIL